MPPWGGAFVVLLSIAEVEKLSWGVGIRVRAQGSPLRLLESKLACGHFTPALISVTEADFKLNVQDQRSLRFSNTGSNSSFFPLLMLNWLCVVDVCSTPFTHQHSTYGLMSVFFSASAVVTVLLKIH